ncbi:hypothetical protein [Marinoscillum sp. MHG1-6]|uniref:hypothetical protein n=1 Tax=Marinoscillum sp. MHG1-6 TaxID=2959627 RepID=UPI002157C0D6|nr:hypothetical protein [Marinoscillum sp. MHG1-6]
MKRSVRIRTLLLVIVLVIFTGCDKIAKLTQFEMEYDETVIIPSSTGINLPFNLFTPDVQSNSESTFAVNDTRKDLIEEIQLTQLDLTLTSPSNGDFGFLKSIEIFISADGLSEVKIAWKENIPSTIDKYMELETTPSDLQEFIKKDNFSLRVNTVTDELITSDHHIDVHSIFFVDAKILGQ